MSVLLVSAGYDHTIRFWEALTGVCSRTIQHPDSQVNRIEITNDKKYLAAAGNPNVRLYDITSTNPNPVTSFEGHKGNITSIQFQQDNKWMVSSSEDGTIKVWDVRAPSVQRNYKTGSPVNEVVIHPNQGELLSCDQDGKLKIWDLSGNKCSTTIVPEDVDTPLQSLSVASDGSMLIAGNNKGSCYVWELPNHTDATTLNPVTKFRSHTKYITKVLISQDSRHLATCSADHTARIWDVADKQNIQLESTLDGHQRWVWDCAFSADSAYLVTSCSDHYVRLWDLSTKEVVRQYNGHNKGVICVALNDV
ncbi:TOR complex subunit lst8 [Hanseniaspora vineae]